VIVVSQGDINAVNGVMDAKGCKLENEVWMTDGYLYEYSCGDIRMQVRDWNFLEGSGYRVTRANFDQAWP